MSPDYGYELYAWIGTSEEEKPSFAYAGQRAIETDTNDVYQWFGNGKIGEWKRVIKEGHLIVDDHASNAPVVNEFFHGEPSFFPGLVSTALAVTANPQDTQITVADATGLQLCDPLKIGPPAIYEYSFPCITNIAGNVLTLDRPLATIHFPGAPVDEVIFDMSLTAGTLSNPARYRIIPPPSPNVLSKWRITKIMVSLTHTTAADDSLFGNLPALTNGLHAQGMVDDQFFTFTNWKSNGDIKNDSFDVIYSDKAGGGLFGTAARLSISQFGSSPVLEGTKGDYLEILIQDDITALSSCRIKAHGVYD